MSLAIWGAGPKILIPIPNSRFPFFFGGASCAFIELMLQNKIKIKYIQPGKPQQNAFVERFNRLYREDVLDAYLFQDIQQVGVLSDQWKEDYNENHSHGSLGDKSPRKYLRTELEEKNKYHIGKCLKLLRPKTGKATGK